MTARYRPDFVSRLWQYPGNGGWVFAPVPDKYAPSVTHACGRTPWKTSVWRGKEGRTLLAVPKKIRSSKGHGDRVRVRLEFNSL